MTPIRAQAVSERDRLRGVTLVEQAIVIAIISLVIVLATPSFLEMRAEKRIQLQADEFYFGIELARSEALKQLHHVTLCKGSESGCVGQGDWSQGWVIFQDVNRNAALDPDEQVLRIHPPLDRVTLKGNRPVANYITFAPNGRPQTVSGSFQAGTLQLCSTDGKGEPRAIVLSSVGRVRVTKSGASCG